MNTEIVNPVPDFLVKIEGENEPLVTIKNDGTVIVHKEGADKEAARLFYESLEIQGRTLFQRVAELEEENKKLKENKS